MKFLPLIDNIILALIKECVIRIYTVKIIVISFHNNLANEKN
jgi:hypothetical protein